MLADLPDTTVNVNTYAKAHEEYCPRNLHTILALLLITFVFVMDMIGPPSRRDAERRAAHFDIMAPSEPGHEISKQQPATTQRHNRRRIPQTKSRTSAPDGPQDTNIHVN
jgi:hypothetical protein